MSVGLSGHAEWDRIKKRLRAELGEDVFNSWFARVDLESITDGAVHLSVPTRFLKNWLQNRYRDRLLALFQEEFEGARQIEFTVRSAIRPRTPGAAVGAEPYDGPTLDPRPVAQAPQPLKVQREAVFAEVRTDDALYGSPLDPRYSFDTFVEGRSNSLALAAARRVAEARPGEAVGFNPLYLHAAVGLGKTHLLQAVARAAKEQGRRVLYLTAEHFMYRFVAALKSQSAIAFKDGLRGIDLLLIDDMQFLQGKQVQQEFCHTLNSLIDGARQVVVAGDRPPVELETLDERVRSRLGGGLLIELHAPDLDLRRRIVSGRIAAARRSYAALAVSDAVIDYVAENVTSSGRDLDGAVNRLVAHNQLTGEPISVEMAETALRDLLRVREAKRVKIEDIQRIVCKQYNVSKADLLSSRRTRTVVRPRQIAMYLSKTLTPRSLPEIGRRFGNRDHTTVLHAVRKIEDMIKTDRAFQDEVDGLKRQIDL
ncbi:chromosomal replication initiator protein DnaA [Prosthecomicrobium hirschii]|uniref:Chromosomal replication initiator protein DnaA n=1 Tax=Prosthecodimorpha hirschii TaxID=665126 RepID=A0A0P6VJG7_9HYPH|nr:chromosomal replication initiator protein DnaA [Prosthecomicrobium hirschii]KPL52602.1 chromosomal replication initiation protein [Prosthecomicrobium hirschii]MCW1841466.1 chromosomal replication initiator protein DnaA [Prosthecomicrobium hirschii]TPQ51553.1 chromosomal replication initiator protein DnaA [Prosthecomicrobium hirschii]